ncbi:unnamed protein product, partial [Tetraodon nigroviridis]
MMFCTTFLSAPPEELHREASSPGGLGPGSCLSSLRRLVLPQDEPSAAARGPVRATGRAHQWAGGPRLGRSGDGCLWDGARRPGGGSALPSKTRNNSPREGAAGPSLPMATVDIKNPEISNIPRYNNSQMNNIVHSSFPKREKKNKGGGKKKRLTKADIGTPSNFQHIGHVGWDPNTGFDLCCTCTSSRWRHAAEKGTVVCLQLNNLDPELKNLFDVCGINEAQLKDKETSKVIYDFIEKNGGVEAVKNEFRRQERRDHRLGASRRGALLWHRGGPDGGDAEAEKAIHSSDEDDDDDEEEDFEDEDEWDD